MFNCIIFYSSSKKYLQFPSFSDTFECLAILDDPTDLQQRHNPKHLPYLVHHMTGYLLKVKYFSNIVTPQKHRGGVATIPPTSLVPRWGYKYACRSES